MALSSRNVMLISALFATLSLCLPSLSSSAVLQSAPKSRSVIHERRNLDNKSLWSRRERIAPDEVFEMRIGLTQQNTHLGHDMLMEVSDPRSPNYGKHLSVGEIVDAFAPSDEVIEDTGLWITSTLGIGKERLSLGAGKGWLTFSSSIQEAEALLDTEYWLYEHEVDGQMAVGTDYYRVPEELAEHIDFVFPGVVLGEIKNSPGATTSRSDIQQRVPKKLRRQQTANATCADLVTPACIKEVYGIPAADKGHPNNSMGIFEQSSWYQNDDLDLFFEAYVPEIPQGTRPRNLSIDEAAWFYDDAGDVYNFPDEADLDIQVAWPIIYPQNVTVFQVDDVYYNWYSSTKLGIFNTFLDALDGAYCNYSAYGETGDSATYDPVYPDTHVVTGTDGSTYDPGTYKLPEMCGVYTPTNVISISYSRSETSFTEAYQKRQCDEFLKLGLMGVSIIVASGDSGTQGAASCSALNLGTYHVQNPVNCPYVTAVGATQLLPNSTDEEVAVDSDSWASSGGFSNFYATPSYQQDAVAVYLAEHYPTALKGRFNETGRGVPDVAALGANIAVAVNGALSTSEGTSASAPLFAAMINLVNEERLAVGKGTVGFVNPVLYANASAIFRDVTVGDNDMCGGLTPGFEAVPGWDPVTGLGTAQWKGLKDVFLSLP